MKQCNFKVRGKRLVCTNAGCDRDYEYRGVVYVAGCKSDPDYHTFDSKALLGDRIEQALSALGVTPENYSHAKEAIGLLPDCNCSERKQMLNEIQEYAKLHGWLSAIAHARQIHKRCKD